MTKKAEMTPKQGGSENTGGKSIEFSVNRRRRRRGQKVGAKIESLFLFYCCLACLNSFRFSLPFLGCCFDF